MTTELIKSTYITNADLLNPTKYGGTAGEGGPSNVRCMVGVITPTSGDTTGSLYKFARLPSTAKVISIDGWFDLASTVTSFTANVGMYYSDSTVDGTTPANQGTSVGSTNTHFASAVNLASSQIVQPSNFFVVPISNAAMNLPLWNLPGANNVTSGDFGGMVDITAVLTGTSSISTSSIVFRVMYADG